MTRISADYAPCSTSAREESTIARSFTARGNLGGLDRLGIDLGSTCSPSAAQSSLLDRKLSKPSDVSNLR